MRLTKLSLLMLLVCLTATAFAVRAQDPPPETPTPGGARPGGPPSTDPQPYDKVITKDAKTKKGIFTVHQVKDKFYY